jgi:hypothetical protein
MQLENQVITLEQAKRLKELGITALATFYFVENYGLIPRMIYDGYGGYEENETVTNALDGIYKNYCYPAFTVAELGVMLPSEVRTGSGGYGGLVYVFNPLGNRLDNCEDFNYSDYTSEAEARGSMLIYLLENNLITVEEVNQRLLNA